MTEKKELDSLKHEKFKEFIHPVILKLFGSSTTGKLEVVGDLPEENCLIVANHTCIEDIPTLAQAVERHFYILVSDEDKNTIDGLALNLNGVEWVHRTSKESRAEKGENIVEILKRGKFFAMYPESTWNLSPNELIMQMNYGCIRMALQANVPIVPVVSFFSDNKRYTIIGEKFYPTEDLTESINSLRDIMSTMVYDEMNRYYVDSYGKDDSIKRMTVLGEEYLYEERAALEKDYWDKYVDKKYSVYKRANSDKSGVREFESQFIFTPKTDDYSFFQEFNSVTRKEGQDFVVKRISSEKKGYMGDSFGEVGEKNHFGYGYNEKVLKKSLK